MYVGCSNSVEIDVKLRVFDRDLIYRARVCPDKYKNLTKKF